MKIPELRDTLAERFGRDYLPELVKTQAKKKKPKSRPKPKKPKKGY